MTAPTFLTVADARRKMTLAACWGELAIHFLQHDGLVDFVVEAAQRAAHEALTALGRN